MRAWWAVLAAGLLLLGGSAASAFLPLPETLHSVLGVGGLVGAVVLSGAITVLRRPTAVRRDPVPEPLRTAVAVLHTREVVLGTFSDEEVLRLSALRRRVRERRPPHAAPILSATHSAGTGDALRCALPMCHRVVAHADAHAQRWLHLDGRWFCSHEHAERFAAEGHDR